VSCVWFSLGSCTNKDISISQSRETLTGIPQYVVQIVNTCVSSECAPYNIHLHCGWFASARIINPKLFKRLSFDDCLVNGGKPLTSSQIITFTYSNSFVYPLSFKSAKFCWIQKIFEFMEKSTRKFKQKKVFAVLSWKMWSHVGNNIQSSPSM
jgi:hypothetical protein